jgi:glucosamine--fructose-6-phosphate aminotransferase (isomerizing)
MRRACGTQRGLRSPNTDGGQRRTRWTRCFHGDRYLIDMSKMLQETRDQPGALSLTLGGGIASAEELRGHFGRRRPRLIVLVARGTSDNAAQFGRYLIEITTRVPVSLAAPSILTLYQCPVNLHDVVVIGISQSGESTDTNAVLEDARKQGATTIGITNNAGSAMASIVEFPLPIAAGAEISIAATKTYTCQLLALYLVAYALNGGIALDQLRKIPEWVRGVLELEEDIEALVERYFFMSRAMTVGRGLNYANALEFGLKLMETCYVVAERFSAADLMHGPIALVEHAFPVFLFAPAGVTWPSMSCVLDRLQELKAETMVITDPRNTAAHDKAARVIEIPQAPGSGAPPGDLYTPIPYIVPAQLFAGHLAALKGLNPDLPRTLHKITRTM